MGNRCVIPEADIARAKLHTGHQRFESLSRTNYDLRVPSDLCGPTGSVWIRKLWIPLARGLCFMILMFREMCEVVVELI
jgi:hypothetical protein